MTLDEAKKAMVKFVELKTTLRPAFVDPILKAEEVVRRKDCRFSHMTYGGECKSCDMWKDDDDFTMTLYLDGDFYCAFAERREDAN